MINMWLNFIKQEEPRVIHWDLLPYAQYGEEKNDINDEIREIIEGVEQKNFQNIRNEIVSKASHKQSLWYVKLLDKFLNAFKVVDINSSQTETGNENGSNFFILVVGNRIIRDRDRREILGHLFAGLYEAKKEDIEKLKNSIVIFRDRWCSCNNKGNLYFVKFGDFVNGIFNWNQYDNILDKINTDIKERDKEERREQPNSNKLCNFYGGKNKIPCY